MDFRAAGLVSTCVERTQCTIINFGYIIVVIMLMLPQPVCGYI